MDPWLLLLAVTTVHCVTSSLIKVIATNQLFDEKLNKIKLLTNRKFTLLSHSPQNAANHTIKLAA